MVLNQRFLQCFIVSRARVGAATKSGSDAIYSVASFELLSQEINALVDTG
jgi:hypothetical protein